MKQAILGTLPPGTLAVLGAALLTWWITSDATDDLDLRVPGMEGPGLNLGELPGADEYSGPPVVGESARGTGRPSAMEGAWPWFRGPERDGICHDSVPLARQWPDAGPEVLWRVELGPGHAGPAVAGGCVYVLDYDVEAQADTMRCLSLDDGREIWRNGYPVVVPENHGMSRTVPAVVDNFVLSLGPKCHVVCWDAQTGEHRWIKDLVHEFGATVPPWYAAQCPLIDGGRLILAPAGETFLIAVDYSTGQIVWESPKLLDWAMTHVSIAPMEFEGRRMYVYCGTRGVAAIAAEDGSVLWQTTEWVGRMATCPTPVPVTGGRIFFSSGYRAGSLMAQLETEDTQLTIKPLFRLRPKEFGSEQHTPVFFEGHLYGVRTDAGGQQLVCLDLDGKEVWNSGEDKYGRGPYLVADGLIYLVDDDGTLTMVEATPERYKSLDSFQVFEDGHDAWGPMALVGGRLIVRDLRRMACLDVAER
jgi:outer membrane protein assembly factor BamB